MSKESKEFKQALSKYFGSFLANKIFDPLEKWIGSGGVQSDWNEEEQESSAFIKNKPFYEKMVKIPESLIDYSKAEWTSDAGLGGDGVLLRI